MQRYFGNIIGNDVLLADDDIFHLTRVMRAKPGEQIEVVCEEKVFLCEVNKFKPLEIKVVKEIKQNNELKTKIILIAALIKGEKLDFLLQKATELGVFEIVLLNTERTIVKIKPAEKELKFVRYNKILKEAAEQSKRNRIPLCYRLLDIKNLASIDADVKIIAYEGEEGPSESFYKVVHSLKENQTVAVLIGPEGGFSQKEVDISIENGFVPVSLGRRILRAETASFYALSVISNFVERK